MSISARRKSNSWIRSCVLNGARTALRARAAAEPPPRPAAPRRSQRGGDMAVPGPVAEPFQQPLLSPAGPARQSSRLTALGAAAAAAPAAAVSSAQPVECSAAAPVPDQPLRDSGQPAAPAPAPDQPLRDSCQSVVASAAAPVQDQPLCNPAGSTISPPPARNLHSQKLVIVDYAGLAKAAMANSLPGIIVTASQCVRVDLDAATVHRALAAVGMLSGVKLAIDTFMACAGVVWWLTAAEKGISVLPVCSLLFSQAMLNGTALAVPGPKATYFYTKQPWEYDKWLIPVHEKGELGHWFLLEVDVQGRWMAVYDSSGNPSDADSLKGIHKAAIGVVKGYFASLQQPVRKAAWKLQFVQHVPQQPDGYTCGYFAAEFGRRICNGESVTAPVTVPDVVERVLGTMVGFNKSKFRG